MSYEPKIDRTALFEGPAHILWDIVNGGTLTFPSVPRILPNDGTKFPAREANGFKILRENNIVKMGTDSYAFTSEPLLWADEKNLYVWENDPHGGDYFRAVMYLQNTNANVIIYPLQTQEQLDAVSQEITNIKINVNNATGNANQANERIDDFEWGVLPGLATRDWVDTATNYLIKTYLITTNSWMTISNETLTVWAVTNAVTNALWSSAQSMGGGGEIDLTFTNAIMAAISGKADKAWGNHAPDGSANPDPGYMVFLNRAATVHAAGFQWSSYGTHAVISQGGTVAFETGGDGAYRVGPDSENWFGYVQGGQVVVGAVAQSIRAHNAGDPEGFVQIDYPYTGGDFPVMWFTPSLLVDFDVQTGVMWVDNLNGTATMTAPAPTAAGFWKATTTYTATHTFATTMPARFIGGVYGSTNDAPVVFDSTVTITSGGNTYRVPAQRVN